MTRPASLLPSDDFRGEGVGECRIHLSTCWEWYGTRGARTPIHWFRRRNWRY